MMKKSLFLFSNSLNKLIVVGLCFFMLFPVFAAETITPENDQFLIEDLKKLDLEELIDIETGLDEVFDVFDGLIKAKKVNVASGTNQFTRAPSVTTVITAQDIEAIGATDLDEVLETVPGLHVARSKLGHNPIYTIRGIYSTPYNPQVLMMINGIPTNLLYSGTRSLIWGGMPVNSIARIEVIRGPGSAVFGADAFAGVINIITKTKEDIEGTSIGSRIGSFNTQDVWALHGGKLGDFDVALTLEYHKTDGQKEIIESDAQTQFDKMFKTEASLAPGPLNLSRDNLDVHLDVSRGHWRWRSGYQGRRDFGSGAGPAEALDPHGRFNDGSFNTDVIYHHQNFSQNWDVTAQLS
jgi:outer membrane receptor protein involved in Fe transport